MVPFLIFQFSIFNSLNNRRFPFIIYPNPISIGEIKYPVR